MQRILACYTLALTLFLGWMEAHFRQDAYYLAAVLLVYPHVSQLMTWALGKNCSRGRINAILVLGDAFILGMAVGIMGFALLPSIAFVALLLFYVFLKAQLYTLLLTTVMLVLGASITQVLYPHIQLAAPAGTTLVAVLAMVLQVLLAATQLRLHNLKSEAVRLELAYNQARNKTLARDLAKYLPTQVWQTIFKQSGSAKSQLKTQRKKLTIFFSDIIGFTDLSEELEPEDLAEVLNGYLSAMTRIAAKHGGTVDKFIGDSIMVFFGDEDSQGAKSDAIAAVSMAIEMRKQMRVLRQRWLSQGIHKHLEIRMGINTGYCTIGSFGAETRMEYTIIGREVNLASRLESAAGPDEILLSGETYSLVKDEIMGRDKGQIQAKGFARPISIYQVMDFRSDLGPNRNYLSHELPGFSMHLDTVNIKLDDIEDVVVALEEALQQLKE